MYVSVFLFFFKSYIVKKYFFYVESEKNI